MLLRFLADRRRQATSLDPEGSSPGFNHKLGPFYPVVSVTLCINGADRPCLSQAVPLPSRKFWGFMAVIFIPRLVQKKKLVITNKSFASFQVHLPNQIQLRNVANVQHLTDVPIIVH